MLVSGRVCSVFPRAHLKKKHALAQPTWREKNESFPTFEEKETIWYSNLPFSGARNVSFREGFLR